MNGPDLSKLVGRLAISADSNEAGRASQWLHETGERLGIPSACITRLDHCLDEALANIIMHGGAGALSSPVELEFKLDRHGAECEAALTISDGGVPFNPLEAASKARPASLAEAELGGLGISMMRSYADRLDYGYHDGRNHLSFMVCWQAGTK